MQIVDKKDKWKVVWYTQEGDRRNIQTLEGLGRKAVITKDKKELLRILDFPTSQASKERVLPNGGEMYKNITKEYLYQAIFDQSENKALGPNRINLKAITMI
jgi:hypothetical protein